MVNMTDSKQITILSGLPVKTLEYMRLALNIAYSTDPYGRENCAEIVRLINKALEEKQYDYYTSFDEVNENNTLGI
jgi:hypothetical protein